MYIEKLSGICREEEPSSIMVWSQERGHEEGEKRKGWYCMRGGGEECRRLQSAPYDRAEEKSMDLHSGYYERGQERREEDRDEDLKQLAHICCEATPGRMAEKT